MRNTYLLLLLLLGLCLSGLAEVQLESKDLEDVAKQDADHLRVHFIDVGAGFAALVETPKGKNILIDGGKDGKSQFKKYVRHFVPEKELAILVVTHADYDHYNNLRGVVDSFDVDNFLYSGYRSIKLSSVKAWRKFRSETLKNLTEGLGDGFAKDFLITHFFNPPRYMRLLEIVSGPKTRQDAVDLINDFGDKRLGKCMVTCKDTPGFIANRIGTLWMASATRFAFEMGLTVEETDPAVGSEGLL